MTHTPHHSLQHGTASVAAARLVSSVRVFLAALVLVVFTGCSSEESRLEALYQTAKTKGRGSIVNQIRTDWYAKDITLVGLIDLAHARVEKDNDLAAAVFAGEVLEAIAQVEPDIKDSEVNDFFYIRLGTLAANSAAIAWNTQPRDITLARKLVLAGPQRWQSDKYWMDHPDHDALASYILFENGEGDEALNRLRQRPDGTEITDKAYDEIEKELRKQRRK